MPRRPRLQYAGAIYHVMARGNRKSTIFHDDQDRRQFLRILSQSVAAYALRILAFCLMGNHYHVMLETPEGNLSDAMQFINGVFAQRSNRRYEQTGHVFEARFRSLVIERESYLLRAARYIVRNPVRAGLVANAADWPWSSYRATAGLVGVPRWLQTDWIRGAFGAAAMRDATARYAEYVCAPASKQSPVKLNAIVLGTQQFEERLLKIYKGHDQAPQPKRVRILTRPTLEELFEPSGLSGSSRDHLICRARMDYGYRFVEIARHLRIDRSTASKAASRVQEESLELDAEIT